MASSKLKIKGVSLIESLVCLVIVGIGFIGVNQMITYATTSIDRSMDSNKINFLSETAVEDIMGDPNNASNYSFSQQCSKNYSSAGSLAEKAKAKWSKHFMQENQLKINNKFKKLPCDQLDSKKAIITSASDRTSVKFKFKSNKGNKEKFIGVVVK
tara:strand:+ start:976 stop:1443 length:468 start_codon:yes stop_codon:yes gene_type:complete